MGKVLPRRWRVERPVDLFKQSPYGYTDSRGARSSDVETWTRDFYALWNEGNTFL